MTKHNLLCLALLLSSIPVFSQRKERMIKRERDISVTTKEFALGERRRGFIGVTIGPSFPIGNYKERQISNAGLGFHANLLNATYLFGDHLGAGIKVFHGRNKLQDVPGRAKFTSWRYSGAMAGPVYSTLIHRNIEFDVHPMVGYAVADFPQPDTSSANVVRSSGSLAINIGITVQFNVASRIGLHAGFDYFNTKARPKGGGAKHTITTFIPSLGVAYRFR